MSAKILIFILAVLHLSMTEEAFDCRGKSFLCATQDAYLICIYDATLNTTVLESNRAERCRDGIVCDENSDIRCDAEAPTTTAAPSLGELPGYTCPSAGRFPHPTDCRRYISCYVSGSVYKNMQLECVNNWVYHPEKGGCTPDATPCDNLNFKCEATGRFADPVNPNVFLWCLKVNGVFQKSTYHCEAGTVYNGVNDCIEPIVISAIKTFALSEDDTPNLYSTSRRILSFQSNDEVDEESDKMEADRINLNSNEDVSVYRRVGN